MKKKIQKFIFVIIVVFGAGVFAGWAIGDRGYKLSEDKINLQAMRLEGYKFISPLLFCFDKDTQMPETKVLENKIVDFIQTNKTSNNLISASIYYRDLTSSETIKINQEEKFAPASMNKIPVMMVYYRLAQSDPEVLTKKIKFEGKIDNNANQSIQPKNPIKAGETYTVEDLIKKMIIESDNNAFFILVNQIDRQTLESTFKDLKISLPEEATADPDFIASESFSYFLRVLYNGTYLNRNYSEKALDLLSKVEFKEGLVAGLPDNTLVAHKFGHTTNRDGEKELHDCGIIYSAKPYVLCIMTKSKASLSEKEKLISDLSVIVYQHQKTIE